MRRGYRLNSTAAFNAYARTANFGIGQIARAGLNKIDDAVRMGAKAVGGAGKSLAQSGSKGGIREAVGNTVRQGAIGVRKNADKVRTGIGIAGGVGAVGLGGAALADRNKQRPMM